MTRAIANTASGNVLIDAMLKQSRWDLTTDLNDVVTFSFPGAVTHYAAGDGSYVPYLFAGDASLDIGPLDLSSGKSAVDVFTTSWDPANVHLQNMARAAFAQISDVAGISFAEKSSTDKANYYTNAGDQRQDGVDLSIGIVDLTSGGFAFQPANSRRGGDVFFDTNPNRFGNNNKALVKGSNDYRVVLHEIGHALGLRHPHEGHSGADLAPTLVMPTEWDSMEFSVMTYRMYVGMDVPEGFDYTSGVEKASFAQSLMMLDIQALQYMYGADYTTNSTDSLYTFSTSTGEMKINGVSQGKPGANRIFLTIWDGGGIDTYDFSTYKTALSIDLAPGGYSSLGTQLAQIGGADTKDKSDDKFARANVFNALQYQGNAASLIENAKGGSKDDLLSGNFVDNRLEGGAGNDVLDGKEGADTLLGGLGDDTLIIGTLDGDNLDGGAGRDTIVFENASRNWVNFATQKWGYEIYNPLHDEWMSLGNWDAVALENATGASGSDKLTGNDLDNVLDGRGGSDTLKGGKGNDTYVVDAYGDVVTELAGEGTDTIKTTLNSYDLATAANVENLEQIGTGSFVAYGNALANKIKTGASNDYLEGGIDNLDTNGDGKVDTKDTKVVDTLVGGKGDDEYLVRDLNDVVVENKDEGRDLIGTKLASYTLTQANVEDLRFFDGAIGHTGTGNALNNAMYGNSGADTLYGLAGNDTLDGGGTDGVVDTLDGGAGDDTYMVYAAAVDKLVEKSGGGSDTINTDGASVNLADAAYANIENVVFRDSFVGHSALGTAAANTLVGNLAADTLTGLDGDDRLDGGGGGAVDTLVGGKGHDTYVVRNGLEVIDESTGDAKDKDTVEIWVGGFGLDTRGKLGDVNARANLENVTIKGGVAGQDRWASGNESVNVLTGGITDDLLDGGWKYDAIDTNMEISDGVVDTLIGGLGDDSYVIRDTKDKLVELADTKTVTGQGVDTVILDIGADAKGNGITYTLAANFENLELSYFFSNETNAVNHNGTGNKADNYIEGNEGANILKGLDGNDVLAGNGGMDTLIGGNGADELFGGSGADIFVLDAKLGPTNIDTIYGFASFDGDRIHLQDSVMAGIKNALSGYLDAQYFLSAASGHSATSAQQRIIYDQAAHTLWYDKDGSGSAAAVQIATMGESVALSNTDFKVI